MVIEPFRAAGRNHNDNETTTEEDFFFCKLLIFHVSRHKKKHETESWTANVRITHRFGYLFFIFTIIYTMKTFKNTFVIMMQTTRETPHFNFVADSHGIVEKGERKKSENDSARFKSSWFNVIFITCRNIEMYTYCEWEWHRTGKRQTKNENADSNNDVDVAVSCNNEWRLSQ